MVRLAAGNQYYRTRSSAAAAAAAEHRQQSNQQLQFRCRSTAWPVMHAGSRVYGVVGGCLENLRSEAETIVGFIAAQNSLCNGGSLLSFSPHPLVLSIQCPVPSLDSSVLTIVLLKLAARW